MSSLPKVRVFPTAEEVARAAAEEIARVLGEAIRARGVAHWATTGGSSAPPVYRFLGEPPLREALDWGRVHVWWGDDRFVPTDHPLSNVLPLEQILLDSGGDASDNGTMGSDVGELGLGVHIPSANLHPIPMSHAIGRGTGVVGAAAAYAADVAEHVPAGADGLPAFDLVWLAWVRTGTSCPCSQAPRCGTPGRRRAGPRADARGAPRGTRDDPSAPARGRPRGAPGDDGRRQGGEPRARLDRR